MQPSSLVFLVIIAVWAAFFVQHWVRRREHLSTARSVDQFSEAMRVLERRSPLPVTDLSSPSPRSYAVMPSRAARPQILVKRAETTPSLSGSGSGSAGTAFEEDAVVEPGPSSAAGRASARRTRAMVMLGALSTPVVAVPLLVMGLLPWWVAFVPVGCLAVAVAFARATARVERKSRATQARASQSTSRPVRRSTPAPAASRAATEAAATEAAATVAASSDVVDVVDVVAQAAPPAAARDELYDVQAVEAARAAAPAAALPEMQPVTPRRPLVDEDDIPLTWDPVPVPRPTYTMKSRVTRPAPTSADLVGDADTEYAAYEEPVRRVAGA